jgi:2'-5' RNA ligase
MRKRRIFIGIGVPSEIKTKLVALQNKIAEKNLPIRLVNLDNLHVTLNFLGMLSDCEIFDVGHTLKLIAQNVSIFDVWLSDIRFFPNQFRINVISVFVQSDGKLEQIQNEIQEKLWKLKSLHLEKREFKPHVTIGRVRGEGIKSSGIEELKNLRVAEGKWQVKEIKLIQSVLSKFGSKYTILQNFKLKE